MSETRCKLCDKIIYHQYAIKGLEDSKTFWYICQCGCLSHSENFDEKVFNKEYKKKYESMKSVSDRYDYYLRLYAPIIEEKTYGRKMLDVGFCTTHVIDGMRNRGWIATGIDLIKNDLINGDFEKHDFKKERFDLIWMGDVLQCFKDPLKAIQKAYKLLRPHGLLFIVTPNTDLMRTDKINMWGHWDMTTNRQFINFEILKEMLSRVDDLSGRFNILFCDPKVQEKRFVSWNNMHVICQKDKIEERILYENQNLLK